MQAVTLTTLEEALVPALRRHVRANKNALLALEMHQEDHVPLVGAAVDLGSPPRSSSVRPAAAARLGRLYEQPAGVRSCWLVNWSILWSCARGEAA